MKLVNKVIKLINKVMKKVNKVMKKVNKDINNKKNKKYFLFNILKIIYYYNILLFIVSLNSKI